MRNTRAFSITELMIVMFIMAIMMGMIMPVYRRAQENANIKADMASMNTIHTALQLYHTDRGEYPPALLGYITQYGGSKFSLEAVPAEKVKNFLYPSRVPRDAFKPTRNRFPFNALTPARYPKRGVRKPQKGEPAVSQYARQAYGPDDGYVALDKKPGEPLPQNGRDKEATKFYKFSGYDVAEVPLIDPKTGGKYFELRYTRFWTDWGLNFGGDKDDDPRQLGYANPPEDTVVTWNSYFRNWEKDTRGDLVPTNEKRDIVLFLGGSAKQYNSKEVYKQSWEFRGD